LRLSKIIFGISGASGAVLALRALEYLSRMNYETHVVVSDTAKVIMRYETGKGMETLKRIATRVYSNDNLFAPMASGSFKAKAMIVMPCSMKTLAGIATGYSDNLILRAADVMLKERKPLVLVIRETPLSYVHAKNILEVSKAGAIVMPATPQFYLKDKSTGKLIDNFVGRVLAIAGIENDLYEEWGNEGFRS